MHLLPPPMFEYTFVTCPVYHDHEAPDSYQHEIVRHAAEGWRLVQVLAETHAVVPPAYTLILERPAQVSAVG